jgi:hypothetical protein
MHAVKVFHLSKFNAFSYNTPKNYVSIFNFKQKKIEAITSVQRNVYTR